MITCIPFRHSIATTSCLNSFRGWLGASVTFGALRSLPNDDLSLKETFPLSYLHDLTEEERRMMDNRYASWLSGEELLQFDYDTAVGTQLSDRSSTDRSVGERSGSLTSAHEVDSITWRDYIGRTDVEMLLTRLRALKGAGDIRLVFDFYFKFVGIGNE